MTPEQFQTVASLVRRECGLVLGEDKTYLVESRLVPAARKWQKASVTELIDSMRSGPVPRALVQDLVDAMVTNESFFFRDRKPFDTLRDHVLPRLIEARRSQRRLRIWSAACSSGQEPYSIAMIVKEMGARLAGMQVEIVATDISRQILEKAEAGTYSQFEVQRGLPIKMLVQYFDQTGDTWRVKPQIRDMVQFRPFNLLSDPSGLGAFDIVFCRNVLIYFDARTKAVVLDRIARNMTPDGALFLGGAETVLGITTRFAPVAGRQGLYAVVQPGAEREPVPAVPSSLAG